MTDANGKINPGFEPDYIKDSVKEHDPLEVSTIRKFGNEQLHSTKEICYNGQKISIDSGIDSKTHQSVLSLLETEQYVKQTSEEPDGTMISINISDEIVPDEIRVKGNNNTYDNSVYNVETLEESHNVQDVAVNDSLKTTKLKERFVVTFVDEDAYEFVGPTYRSLNDKYSRRPTHMKLPPVKSYRCKDDCEVPSKRMTLDDSTHEMEDNNIEESKLKPSIPELSRSQYSLVSTGELTAEALQVWLGLPKKIKYDPELAPFQQRYEKEYGKTETVPLKTENGSAPETKRLPLVKSAPHLNNNVRATEDTPPEKNEDVVVLDPGKNGLECGSIPKKPSKMAVARHYVKMSLLLACWLFFTLVFLTYNEKEELVMNSSVYPREVKTYILNVPADRLSVKVKLSGPFLTEQTESRMNQSEIDSSRQMVVWLERWMGSSGSEDDVTGREKSNPWKIIMQDDEDLDFSKGERRSATLTLSSNRTDPNQSDPDRSGVNRTDPVRTGTNQTSVYALRMKTNALKSAPFTMSYTLSPLEVGRGVIYSCLLLCGLYVLIIFEVINRTMAAVLVSTTSLATLAIVGERPTLPQLISWLDVETLLLLFSMMLLVAIMAETGMFDFLAVFTFEVTKGKLWPLITLLCIITAFLSTFLDNVTTVLLMTPVTIRLCEVMDLDPVPILMSMVLFSNIGGTATPVGDPPNVIIASNKNVVQAGINFTNFTMHMTLGILLVCVQTYFQLRYIYRDTNKLRLNVPREIQDLRHQISIWRRAIESLPHLSKDQHVVRERLERKMRKLNGQLEIMIKERNKRVCPKDTFQSTLEELKQKYKIRDKMLLLKSTIAISFVVIMFFLHSIPELNRVSLGWTALLGALLLLLLADREDLEPILHRVEWSTLLFFASLFVLMEALSKLGLIEFIGGLTERLILGVDERARLAVALLLMLWVSGVTSAFVDNIPLTTMMVRVVITLGSNPNLNLPMAPLIWALSFGACLGGNGTLIGASANVVCAGVAEQHGYRFTFMQFFRVGFPVMIGHLVVASGYLLLCHCVFTWH